MFIFSFKASKRKILTYTIIVLFIAFLSLSFFISKNNKMQANCKNGEYSLSAKNNVERVNFLSQFGWKTSEEPIEISTISIPSEFNATYESYNDIQKKQGLDLSKYREKTCTRYTYQILNYKDSPCNVRANLLVFKGRVIGGDVSSVTLNGFMHGFFYPDNFVA